MMKNGWKFLAGWGEKNLKKNWKSIKKPFEKNNNSGPPKGHPKKETEQLKQSTLYKIIDPKKSRPKKKIEKSISDNCDG
jgi:hypothetical protein